MWPRLQPAAPEEIGHAGADFPLTHLEDNTMGNSFQVKRAPSKKTGDRRFQQRTARQAPTACRIMDVEIVSDLRERTPGNASVLLHTCKSQTTDDFDPKPGLWIAYRTNATPSHIQKNVTSSLPLAAPAALFGGPGERSSTFAATFLSRSIV